MAEEGLESGDRALLLDCGRVSYISSAGLRACMILARKFSAPGQAIAICSLSALNREVVAVSGFDHMIPVHDTVESAIAGLRDS